MQPLTKIVVIIAVVVLAFAVALLVVGRMGLLRGSAPSDLGVHDGRLKPPSKTANSVSSQAALYPGHPQAESARIEPFHYSGDGAVAMERLARVVKASSHTRIVSQNAEYLRAESTTPMLQFHRRPRVLARSVKPRDPASLGQQDRTARLRCEPQAH